MEAIEIVLIVLGIIGIVVSCILVDRSGDSQVGQTSTVELDYLWKNSEQRVLELERNLRSMKDETLESVEAELSTISNEKIMAVNEFSDQIIERIKGNHEEVVFLYKMLSDKETEVKSLLKQIEQIKKDKNIAEKLMKESPTAEGNVKKAKEENQQAKFSTKSNPAVDEDNGKENDSNHKLILDLYSQGKSIVDISKLLKLGQGEVKFVIDLNRGKLS